MRKILGISASTRLWGNCETSVKQVLAAAMEAGARTTFVRLPDRDIGPCKGCFRCLKEGGRCPADDDLYELLDEVKASDDIVLASPVYFLSAAASLVALMDRLLTVNAYMTPGGEPGRAVTLTLMGNGKWRGVAEPFVNLTASLLGFEIMESLSLVAEGPGEVIVRQEVAERLTRLGRALAKGEPPEALGRCGVCPVCRSDFFRIEPPAVVCPVCGLKGDLGTYTAEGVFAASGDPPRWGRRWLAAHIDSWIRPSLERYVGNRKEILSRVRHLKAKYCEIDERGKQDV
jgi:multimeric flavodoxin WrbA